MGEREWRNPNWRIAEDITITTPGWEGRLVVEDVTEETPTTVTYKMRSLDGTPPLALGLLPPTDT